MYDPTASSLTRQNWGYQQELIDLMGEGVGWGMGQADAPASAVAPVAEVDSEGRKILKTCGTGFLAAGLVGFTAGKVGVVPTAAAVTIAYILFLRKKGL